MIVNYETMIYEKNDKIGVITLNRPDKMNTMTPKFLKDFDELLTIISNDDHLNVIILKANGKAFCAGGDFELMRSLDTASKTQQCVRSISNTISKMYKMSKPIISAVDGYAVGGGANLALSCDFVFASEKARFGEVFVNIGLIPDTGGLWAIAKKTGIMRAKELCMTGRMIDASEAKGYGMVLDIIPSEKLYDEVMDFARMLAEKPPISIGYIKQISNTLDNMTLETYCDLESAFMGVAIMTEDHKEGLAAFVEKRNPKFHGR